MSIYTREDWTRDRNFSAKPGQEIEEDIYEDMFDALPPYGLPRRPETAGYTGFCMGEPANTDKDGHLTYLAFGKLRGKCYYLGEMPLISTTPYKEIIRLRKMLNNAGIPYKFTDNSARVPDGESTLLVNTMYQITYTGLRNAGGSVYLSAVEGDYSYGGKQDKIEIMRRGDDDATGGLTAEEVFNLIKEHYDRTHLE